MRGTVPGKRLMPHPWRGNWWLQKHNYLYNAELPALCHAQLNGTITSKAAVSFQEMANQAANGTVSDLTQFSKDYLNVFTTGFHFAFAVAIGALLISLLVYVFNKYKFPNPKDISAKKTETKNENIPQLNVTEIRQRIYALFAVFGVVIFFWFSFHQNGLTLTYFAKDYTDLSGINISIGEISIRGAELFQSINPFFVVFLTPLVVGLFGWLNSRGKEPSTPKKIAIGMLIAAFAYVVMAIGSSHLPLFDSVDPQSGGTPLLDSQKVTPFLLIITYFILTVAELFISPLGISFVSKVAPPQYQGIMQGGWLGATAVGNQLLFIGAIFYKSMPLWITWGLFVVVCLISMTMMLVMLKWLERVAK